MNWGHKITLLYVGFATLIIGMTIASTKYKVHLVTKDYYAEEIRYDEKADKIRNTQSLEKAVEITYLFDEQDIQFEFPAMEGIQGEILLYRPSNSTKDQSFALELTDNQQSIDVSRLSRGQWKVILNWTADGKEYFQDKSIIL